MSPSDTRLSTGCRLHSLQQEQSGAALSARGFAPNAFVVLHQPVVSSTRKGVSMT